LQKVARVEETTSAASVLRAQAEVLQSEIAKFRWAVSDSVWHRFSFYSCSYQKNTFIEMVNHVNDLYDIKY
jgi:hypothetical protein